MKIAIIDHFFNPGGGSRVTRSLLSAIKKARDGLEVTFFGNPNGVKREKLQAISQNFGIDFQPLASMLLSGRSFFNIQGTRYVVSLLQRKYEKIGRLAPFALSGQLHKELEQKIKGYDVALFTWPFHLKCPDLDCPMVGIFHDFNFHYSFGSTLLTTWMRDFLIENTPILLSKMTPIVSTEYMKQELEKFYPHCRNRAYVVPIAPFADPTSILEEERDAILKKFNIPKPYLLVPTNAAIHKNNGTLMAAFSLLKEKKYPHSLVFVGHRTETFNGRACIEGAALRQKPQNVFGLGYVNNQEIDALIQGAEMVINASLYEGGNGPGLDAWGYGIPVAMSNISPFIEHLACYDVKAAVFDPRNAQDIADKIAFSLDHKEKTLENAHYSKESIRSFSWEGVAKQYLNIFDREILLKSKALK